jgi:16S rRNA (cytidine1402-2'-O)-methyltransferase
MNGKLFLVSTPIGNYGDITIRAIETLKEVDFIICEEFKEARRLLSHLKIEKELFSLNEHNEKESSEEIIKKLNEGKEAALISDCGTPAFSDPGNYLVELCYSSGIQVVPVPGANSILPALVASGFDVSKFYYYGWLSPKKDIRRKELLELKKRKGTIVIMETPYRLIRLLQDIVSFLGKNINIVLAFELTTEREHFYRGTADEVLKIAEEENLKGEFVVVVENKSHFNQFAKANGNN